MGPDRHRTMKKTWKKTECLLGVMVAAAAFVVYLRTLQNGFINYDDSKFIYKNPRIRSFGLSFLKWAFSNFDFSNWYPLTWISHALDYAVWGLNPVGYHLTNIVLHSANVFLVTVLAVRLIEVWEGKGGRAGFLEGKGKLIAGVATGLLFGLHPLHVESVAWAAERKDVLYGLFFLLSLLAYTGYAAGPFERPRYFARQHLLSLFFFAMALMSKPMAVSLPLVLLVMDWFPFGRIFSLRSFRTAFAEKMPFIVLSGLVSGLTLMAKNGKIVTLKSMPVSHRALVAARSLALYLWKMALPVNLIPYYPYPKNVSFLSPEYFLSAALVLAATAFCLFKAKKQKIWLACWGYFIITLLPVIGIVQVNDHWIADRYAYLPSLGPFLLAGVAAAWTWEKAGTFKRERLLKAAAASAALLAALSMSYLTFRQIGVWKNSIVFWNYVIRKEPGRIAVAYYDRGNAFEKTDQAGRAVTDYNKAIALDPVFFRAYFNLGEVLAKMGNFKLSEAAYEKAGTLRPSSFETYTNMGIVSIQMRQYEVALADFSKAILLNPNFAFIYVDRGTVYMETGRNELAASDFWKACNMGDEDGCQSLRKLGF